MDPASGDPTTLGRFRVTGRLGEGRTGRVLLGVGDGGQRAAVRIVYPGLAADPGFRDALREHVRAAAAAPPWFTAPVLDADTEAVSPWVATGYIDGPSMARYVAEAGPLGEQGAVALATRMAEGLVALHAAGLVHGDLTPSTVLLAEDGPRVIDFGISRAVEASALTHTRLVVGSPGFMSPEQAEGREVGPPSDIFSLGAVLAFAATGQGPFGSGSTPALVYRVVHGGPQLDLVPAEVRSLAERCLAKDPALRPTAADLLAAAAHPAAGWLPTPVTRAMAAGPGRPPRQTRRLGRWRPLTATLVLSALVGAGATAAVTMTAGSAPAHASQSAPRATPAQTLAPASTPASSAPASSATAAPQTPPAATTPAYVPPPSTPPATVTSPPTSSAPPSPTTSPSPSTSSSTNSTPPTPAPGSSAPASQAGY
jgi:serine/threonine protein kinase